MIKPVKFVIMFEILDITKNNLIAFKVRGKVEKKDYDKPTPLLEKTKREFDTRKLYVEIENIEGIEPAALWEDFKVYFLHVKNFKKIAVVGQGGVIEKITNLTKPFVSGEIKFFETGEAVNARDWVEE